MGDSAERAVYWVEIVCSCHCRCVIVVLMDESESGAVFTYVWCMEDGQSGTTAVNRRER